jgi:hypothetical protein
VRDSQGRTDTDTCTVYVVSIGIGTNESTYVAVNNDDDNENGIMDMCEDGTVSNEDTQPYDLRKILLSVNTPKLDDKVKLVASPDGGEPRIQVWSYRNKGSRIIPRSVPNEPDKYYVEWPSGSVPSELYVEAASYASAPGNHPYVALGYIGVNRNTTPPTEELVFGDPPAPVNFTFLEVDVDIDGVKDDYDRYWKFTEETTPGGFIPLNGLVKINLMSLAPSDLPINASAPVTLKAISGGDKIRIWDNENKAGTPITLPKKYESRWSNPIPLWVEGIGLSSIPRDIILALEYSGFEDRIRMTVYNPCIRPYSVVNEIPYGAYGPTWGTCPSSCPPGPCDGEDSYELDDCFNELEVSCCQEDGSGGALGCAYRVFYNNTLLSSCVFAILPENEVYRKIATIEGTDKKVFTKIKHINEKSTKYIQGCLGYYCTKFYEYDCITGASNTIWRRRADSPPLNEQDGETCPGH